MQGNFTQHYHPNGRVSDSELANPIVPLQSTLDTIAKIRAGNEAIRKENIRLGRKMTIEEQKAFLMKLNASAQDKKQQETN